MNATWSKATIIVAQSASLFSMSISDILSAKCRDEHHRVVHTNCQINNLPARFCFDTLTVACVSPCRKHTAVPALTIERWFLSLCYRKAITKSAFQAMEK